MAEDKTPEQEQQEKLQQEQQEAEERRAKQADEAQNDYSVEPNSGAYPQPGQTVAPAPTSDYVGVAEEQTPQEAAEAAARGRDAQVQENAEQGIGAQDEESGDESESKGKDEQSSSRTAKKAAAKKS